MKAKQVLCGALLEATTSRRQLRVAETGSGQVGREGRGTRGFRKGTAVRTCGMEALDEPQPRAKAKLRKASETGASVPDNATPDIQSWSGSSGDACGGTLRVLTRGDLPRSPVLPWQTGLRRRLERCRQEPPEAYSNEAGVGGKESTTTHRCPGNEREKSDHLVVVMKPGNAGGAKGVTR